MATTNAAFIWSIANKLRGPYQPNQYGDVILPFTILRRLDAILAPTKAEVLKENEALQRTGLDPVVVLRSRFGLPFVNTSVWDFDTLAADPTDLADNLIDCVEGFSGNIRDVFAGFRLAELIADLDKKDRLFLIVKDFANVDLHPDRVSGHDMGYIFEELIRKFAESNNAQAGDHFTPREVIALMVDLLYADRDLELTTPGIVRTVYDPAAGTGGMLSVAYDHLLQMNPEARPVLFGQEVNPRSYAMCKSDLVIKGQSVENIYEGDTLVDDGFAGEHFDFLLSNPPFGRKSSLTMVGADGREVREDREIERQDFVATTSNKQLNFVQHIVTILETNGRAAVVLPDNVLFEGGAGETIRRKLLTDYDLHTMLRLPTGIFYAQGVKANVLFFDKKMARPGKPWTEKLWVYDLRTNKHFTLKQKPLQRSDLDEFVDGYKRAAFDERVESERWKAFTYDEIVARDKANLDITWLRDESLDDLDSLPSPDIIAREIVEDLTAALAEFEAVASALEEQLASAPADE